MKIKKSGPSFFAVWATGAIDSLGSAWREVRGERVKLAATAALALAVFVLDWTLPWLGTWLIEPQEVMIHDKSGATPEQWSWALGEAREDSKEGAGLECAVDALNRFPKEVVFYLSPDCAQRLDRHVKSLAARDRPNGFDPVAFEKEKSEGMQSWLESRLSVLLASELREGAQLGEAVKSSLARIKQEEPEAAMKWEERRQAGALSQAGADRWRAAKAVQEALGKGRKAELSRAQMREALTPAALWSRAPATPLMAAAQSPEVERAAFGGGLMALVLIWAGAVGLGLIYLLARICGAKLQNATQARRQRIFQAWEAKQMGAQAGGGRRRGSKRL